tara:strand:- start:3177 stop:3716 length:540 start_codon:yes stop_codon:yes gene_type:complete
MSRFCVIKGTQITLENDKTIEIEKLKAEDKLLSFSISGIENTQNYETLKSLWTKDFKGDFSIQLIKNIWKNEVKEYYTINNNLSITEDHYVFVKSDDIYYWKEVKDLEIDDYLFRSDNSFERVETIVMKKETMNVYNLAVNSIYTYFANGYLVHNGSPCNACSACGAASSSSSSSSSGK